MNQVNMHIEMQIQKYTYERVKQNINDLKHCLIQSSILFGISIINHFINTNILKYQKRKKY